MNKEELIGRLESRIATAESFRDSFSESYNEDPTHPDAQTDMRSSEWYDGQVSAFASVLSMVKEEA